jgi:hypothetical protein
MRRFAFSILGVLILALLIALAGLWFTPQGKLRQFLWQAPTPKQVNFDDVVPPAMQVAAIENMRLIAMQDKPIFAVTRRPPPAPPPPAAPPPVDVLSGAKVTGMYSSPDGAGIFLNLAGKNRRVRLNESVDGWVLTSIEGRSANFTAAGQLRTLPLSRAVLVSGPAGAPLSAAAPPSPPPPAAAPAEADNPPASRSRSTGAVFGGTRVN